MANADARCTVTIDGEKFDAASASVVFSTLKDRAGMPEMGSLVTSIRVWVDFHDDQNMPFGRLKKMFDLANVVVREKIKDIKIEFWKDESKQDALCSYAFKGWISRYETSNPLPDYSPQAGTSTTNPVSTINHLLVMDLEPVMNQQNFKEVRMSN